MSSRGALEGVVSDDLDPAAPTSYGGGNWVPRSLIGPELVVLVADILQEALAETAVAWGQARGEPPGPQTTASLGTGTPRSAASLPEQSGAEAPMPAVQAAAVTSRLWFSGWRSRNERR